MLSLGTLFEERLFPLEPGSCWDSYRKFSPNGPVPCLHDGDTVVWDTLAIVEYLAERHDGVWPGDSNTRAWTRCVASEMHSGFGALHSRCGMNCALRVRRERPRTGCLVTKPWSSGTRQGYRNPDAKKATRPKCGKPVRFWPTSVTAYRSESDTRVLK